MHKEIYILLLSLTVIVDDCAAVLKEDKQLRRRDIIMTDRPPKS